MEEAMEVAARAVGSVESVMEVAARGAARAVVAKEAARARVAAARAEAMHAIGCSSPGSCQCRWGNSCQRAQNTPCAIGRRPAVTPAAAAVTAARQAMVPRAAIRASTRARLRSPLAMLRTEAAAVRRAAHRVGLSEDDEGYHRASSHA